MMLRRHGTRLEIGTAEDLRELEMVEAKWRAEWENNKQFAMDRELNWEEQRHHEEYQEEREVEISNDSQDNNIINEKMQEGISKDKIHVPNETKYAKPVDFDNVIDFDENIDGSNNNNADNNYNNHESENDVDDGVQEITKDKFYLTVHQAEDEERRSDEIVVDDQSDIDNSIVDSSSDDNSSSDSKSDDASINNAVILEEDSDKEDEEEDEEHNYKSSNVDDHNNKSPKVTTSANSKPWISYEEDHTDSSIKTNNNMRSSKGVETKKRTSMSLLEQEEELLEEQEEEKTQERSQVEQFMSNETILSTPTNAIPSFAIPPSLTCTFRQSSPPLQTGSRYPATQLPFVSASKPSRNATSETDAAPLPARARPTPSVATATAAQRYIHFTPEEQQRSNFVGHSFEGTSDQHYSSNNLNLSHDGGGNYERRMPHTSQPSTTSTSTPRHVLFRNAWQSETTTMRMMSTPYFSPGQHHLHASSSSASTSTSMGASTSKVNETTLRGDDKNEEEESEQQYRAIAHALNSPEHTPTMTRMRQDTERLQLSPSIRRSADTSSSALLRRTIVRGSDVLATSCIRPATSAASSLSTTPSIAEMERQRRNTTMTTNDRGNTRVEGGQVQHSASTTNESHPSETGTECRTSMSTAERLGAFYASLMQQPQPPSTSSSFSTSNTYHNTNSPHANVQTTSSVPSFPLSSQFHPTTPSNTHTTSNNINTNQFNTFSHAHPPYLQSAPERVPVQVPPSTPNNRNTINNNNLSRSATSIRSYYYTEHDHNASRFENNEGGNVNYNITITPPPSAEHNANLSVNPQTVIDNNNNNNVLTSNHQAAMATTSPNHTNSRSNTANTTTTNANTHFSSYNRLFSTPTTTTSTFTLPNSSTATSITNQFVTGGRPSRMSAHEMKSNEVSEYSDKRGEVHLIHPPDPLASSFPSQRYEQYRGNTDNNNNNHQQQASQTYHTNHNDLYNNHHHSSNTNKIVSNDTNDSVNNRDNVITISPPYRTPMSASHVRSTRNLQPYEEIQERQAYKIHLSRHQGDRPHSPHSPVSPSLLSQEEPTSKVHLSEHQVSFHNPHQHEEKESQQEVRRVMLSPPSRKERQSHTTNNTTTNASNSRIDATTFPVVVPDTQRTRASAFSRNYRGSTATRPQREHSLTSSAEGNDHKNSKITGNNNISSSNEQGKKSERRPREEREQENKIEK